MGWDIFGISGRFRPQPAQDLARHVAPQFPRVPVLTTRDMVDLSDYFDLKAVYALVPEDHFNLVLKAGNGEGRWIVYDPLNTRNGSHVFNRPEGEIDSYFEVGSGVTKENYRLHLPPALFHEQAQIFGDAASCGYMCVRAAMWGNMLTFPDRLERVDTQSFRDPYKFAEWADGNRALWSRRRNGNGASVLRQA